MSALTGITAVQPTLSTGQPERVQFGATTVPGQPVYRHSDTKCYPADANASLAASTAVGIVLVGGATNSYGYIVKTGDIELIGASMTPGVAYYVGPTAGDIVPAGADLITGCNVNRLFTAKTATGAKMSLEATGAVV